MPKYLFRARYKDGSIYEQTDTDTSQSTTGKNAFYDIHYSPWKPESELSEFSIFGEGKEYSVSLLDGHFEEDRVSFWSPEQSLQNFRLIYFLRRKKHFNLQLQLISEETFWRIGWQATNENGENVQEIKEFD